MKKKLLIIILLFSFTLISCGNKNTNGNENNQNDDNIEINPQPDDNNGNDNNENNQEDTDLFVKDVIDKCKINISDAKGLCIYNNEKSKTPLMNLENPIEPSTEPNLDLGIVKEDNTIESATFEKEPENTPEDEPEKEPEKEPEEPFNLYSVDAEPYKIKNFGDFTAFSIVNNKFREQLPLKLLQPYEDNNVNFYSYFYPNGELWSYPGYYPKDIYIYDRNEVLPEKFDDYGYICDEMRQSYLINNLTGKIYSMESFGIFDIINGMVAKRTDFYNDNEQNINYYNIEIDKDDNLILTDILPNKNVIIYSCHIDNYNWIVVFNDSLDIVDSQKKIIYIKAQNDEYFMGTDNNLYKLSKEKFNYPIKIFKNGIFIDINNTDPIRKIEIPGIYFDDAFYYKNNIIMFNSTHIVRSLDNDTSLHFEDYSCDYVISDDMKWIISTATNKIRYYPLHIDEFIQNKQDVVIFYDKMIEIENDFNYKSNAYMVVDGIFTKLHNVYEKNSIYNNEYYQLVDTGNRLECKKIKSVSYAEYIIKIEPLKEKPKENDTK